MNIFKIIRHAWQHDKRHESSQQMLVRISIKFLTLIFIILMFESLIDWFLMGMHGFFELIHLLIETIEYSLILILEHSLQTNQHQSEVIIVNTVIIGILYSLFRLYRNTPKLCLKIKRNFYTVYLKHIRRESACWRSLTLEQKANLIICYFAGLSCLLFLFTL